MASALCFTMLQKVLRQIRVSEVLPLLCVLVLLACPAATAGKDPRWNTWGPQFCMGLRQAIEKDEQISERDSLLLQALQELGSAEFDQRCVDAIKEPLVKCSKLPIGEAAADACVNSTIVPRARSWYNEMVSTQIYLNMAKAAGKRAD